MISFSDSQLTQWTAEFFWPFLRVGALIMATPVLSIRQIPARFKILLAVMVTWLIMPLLPPSPVVSAFSADAFLIALQQVAIGVTMGFMFQLAFQALIFGGQVMAYSMGLGFAHMMDPQNGVQVPVVSQYWLILAMIAFLLTNAHLLLIGALVDSFEALPVAVDGLTRAGLWGLLEWGGVVFAAGVAMSMPVLIALLLVNVGLGVVARAAPQLNIFAVGFPVTLLIGLILMWLTVPQVMARFDDLTLATFEQISVLLF